uniref:1,4-dihydroxy-2-naphthoate polyprenyltransferase n=1 Tax=Catalpa bungei TaxID=265496 RepID=A0A142CD02_9LAMI|nr:1,4-dihydroxy-2-naphthoate polyprenyltransferase [Catalpa bungei]
MSTHSLNLRGVLSETKRIINAHSRHFLALSVLFLLPLSFSLIVYPALSQSPSILSDYHRSVFFFSRPEPEISLTEKSHLLLPIIYGLFVLIFSLCATASITYSTFHGFYGRPVKFTSSIKSIFFSFLPLIATLIAIQIIAGLIVFAFGGFTALVYFGISLFGVDLDYDNVYFLGFVFLIVALIVGLLLYFKVEWYLANVIVVVESQWGFSPLKRSSYLVKGMRGVAFAMIMLFGILLGFLCTLCSSLVPNSDVISGGWVSWAFIFQTVVYTGFMTILMLYCVAANAVLFMYCKALHGELAFEIAEEFAHEYISLPFDDGKVPHVVYVV